MTLRLPLSLIGGERHVGVKEHRIGPAVVGPHQNGVPWW
jgi:hypothetical protein